MFQHYDSGSTVTIDIMLSDPAAEDFEGGRFQTLEADGELVPHRSEMGDAQVFVSHKYHFVAPLPAGAAAAVQHADRGSAEGCSRRA